MRSFHRASKLPTYPGSEPPWRWGQGEPELKGLLASRPARLDRLSQLLREFDIDLTAGLDAEDPTALASTLDSWTTTQWPSIAHRDWAWPEHFDMCEWAGGEQAAIYTLIVDTGVALGELIMRHRPGLAWGVDRYERHAVDGVKSFGRVLVLDTAAPVDSLTPAVCDAIDQAFMRYQSIAFDDGLPGRFIDGMRPLLWDTHRHLFWPTP